MQTRAHAKINFTLEVLGLRADGYHNLRSVVVPISLADKLTLEPAETTTLQWTGPSLTAALETLPPEKNLAIKAVRLLQQECGKRDNVAITIEKHIPAGGGLGGGSADAATVLKALNELWKLNLSIGDLMCLGAQLGSDVPALVHGGTVLMEGRGEYVSPFPNPPNLEMALLTPPAVSTSTKKVYEKCISRLTSDMQILDNMHLSFVTEDVDAICAALQNDLIVPAIALHPEIERAMNNLRKAGCRGVSMTGSGATAFAITRPFTPVPGCVMVSTAAFDAA